MLNTYLSTRNFYVPEWKKRFLSVIENKNIFQFVYSKTYPEVYSFVERQGIDLRNEFHFKFKEWKDEKKQQKFEEQQQLPPPGGIQKELVTESDREEEKRNSQWAKTNEMEEKNQIKKKKKANCSQK